MNVGTLTIEMAANIGRLQADMSQAKTLVTDATRSIASAADYAKGALLGLASIGSVMAFKSMVDDVIQAKVELQRLAIQTGASVESLSAIGAVAKITGTDIGTVATAINKMQKNLALGTEDGKGAADALKAIGISFNDFKTLKADEQLLQVAKAFDKFEDGGGKAAGAQLIFGKAGAQLLPLMKELAEKNELVGKTTTASAIEATEYAKNIKQLEAAGNAWKREMVDAMLPTLVKVSEAFVTARKEGGLLAGVWAGLATLLTGDDQFKNDKALVEQTERLMQLQNGMDKLRSNGYDASTLAVKATMKQIDAVKAEIATTQAYRKELAQVADAKAKAAKAKDDERAKNGQVPITGAGDDGRGLKDDPTRKILEGKLKAQEEFIAAEKTQLKTREQYLDFYRGLEYFNLRETETKKQELVADNLKTTLGAYDKELADLAIYMAKVARITDREDGRNKMAEVNKRRAAAEVEANKLIGDSVLALMAVQRQFDLATIERTRQDAIANSNAQFQIDMLGMETLEVQKLTEARRIKLQLDERIYLLKKLDPNADTSGAAAQAAAQTAIATAKIEESYKKQRIAVFGADEAVRKYIEDIGNQGAQMERIFTNAFKGMEDALVNFVKTGKLDFKSLADGIITELIRIQVQQSIMQPISSAFKGAGGAAGLFDKAKSLFGFADGGIMSSQGSMPLHAYSSGGVASSPQLAMFGEGSTPEAYVPLPDGRSIPVTMRGNAGGGGVTIMQPITINATNASAETVGQIRALFPTFLAENKRAVEGIIQRAAASRGGRLTA